jgi:hypothetical protein
VMAHKAQECVNMIARVFALSLVIRAYESSERRKFIPYDPFAVRILRSFAALIHQIFHFLSGDTQLPRWKFFPHSCEDADEVPSPEIEGVPSNFFLPAPNVQFLRKKYFLDNPRS